MEPFIISSTHSTVKSGDLKAGETVRMGWGPEYFGEHAGTSESVRHLGTETE